MNERQGWSPLKRQKCTHSMQHSLVASMPPINDVTCATRKVSDNSSSFGNYSSSSNHKNANNTRCNNNPTNVFPHDTQPQQSAGLLGTIGGAVLDNIPCPLLLFTRTQGTIVHANASFGSFVGRSKEKISGCNVSEFLCRESDTSETLLQTPHNIPCDTPVTCKIKRIDISGM